MSDASTSGSNRALRNQILDLAQQLNEEQREAFKDIVGQLLTPDVRTTDETSAAFQKHDYVLYTGSRKHWNGFYIVHRMNSDGSVFLRQSNGAEVDACPASDLRLLYRPTAGEIELATPQTRVR